MAFPEAWPVATSRGGFTAAAAWFCFSFDCFSLVSATATSDKHANPNTKILLFIFSLLCAGKRTTLALSIRAPDKLSPFRLRDVGRLRRAPQVTEVLAGRVARALARENSIDAAASVLARALWEEHDLRVCPERSRRAPTASLLSFRGGFSPEESALRLLTTTKSRCIMTLTSPWLWALL